MLSTNAGPNWIRRRAKFFLFLLSTVGAVSRGTATIELVSSIESRRYVPALRDHAGRRRFAQAPRCLWLLLIRCWTQATLAPMSGSMSARFWIGSMSTCRIRQIASPKAGPFFWFKSSAKEGIKKIWELVYLLRQHGRHVEVYKCRYLATIYYQDQLQVAASLQRKTAE